jgi:hypothetical protein
MGDRCAVIVGLACWMETLFSFGGATFLCVAGGVPFLFFGAAVAGAAASGRPSKMTA